MKTFQETQKGFMALMSSIVMSAVLIIITTALSLSSFFSRYSILETEFKLRSKALAEACVDSALVKIALDTSYSPTNELVPIGDSFCIIKNIVTAGQTKMIFTQGNYQESITNLQVEVQTNNFKVISWVETSN